MKKHLHKTSIFINLLLFLCALPAVAGDLTETDIQNLYNTYFNTDAYNYVSVHDPSVVIGYQNGSTITGEKTEGATKVYYIFGSHMAWARSNDLENWSTFTNNINTSYSTLFAEPATWSAKGSDDYNLSGNQWAPDVVWNKDMQKWCMYMSINGDYWYSSIVLLTATSLDGDWTYVGPVVYSGFTSQSEAQETDFYDVIDAADGFPERYVYNRNGNRTYGQNAIDPCVFYDEEGNLWMSYGSWFGGIYMLRLDGSNGLRDYSYTYETTDGTAANATSDAYQGLKIAGGNHVSGEASYIEYINDTYYLFMTNGALTAAGGYNMRVFASDAVTGPYVDMTGEDARYSSSNTGVGSINGHVGLRLMSYYKWGWMNDGYTAQGHNSAVVDEDGKSFLVYHTRFDNGTEGHQVRVHQLFQTKNGFLTAAPFQYSGESLTSTPYSTDDIVGRYSILYHGLGTDYANLECVQEQEIVLNSNGTVTGAYTGTWSEATDGPYISITINSVTFEGVFLNQKLEGLGMAPLCFTAVGNDMSVYGYKMAGEGKPFPEDATVAYNVYHLNGTVPSTAYSSSKLSLPSEGHYGATYTWSWDESLISADGMVNNLSADTSTQLTLTISCGDYNYTTTYDIQLLAQSIADLVPIDEDAMIESYADISSFNNASPSGNINSKTGLSLSFHVDDINSDWDLIAHSSDNSYSLLLSVLHYSNNDFYEAKATISPAAIAAGYGSTPWTIFLDTSCFVTVSFNTDGSITYYKDGELMLTYAANETPSWSGGTSTTPADITSAVINYYRSGQLIFDTDVKNIVVGYAADLDLNTYEPFDISGYTFYEDYDYYGTTSSWTCPNGTLSTIYDSSLESNYMEVSAGSSSGNRSAINTFSGVDELSNYDFSFDVCLRSGNVSSRSVSEVSVISTDNINANNSTSSNGYIFKLVTPQYNGSNGSTWYVNGDTSNELTIASGTWVTISGTVDVNNKTADVTITNRETEMSIYSATTTVNGNGILKGLWVLAGRGSGHISIDNIEVINNSGDSSTAVIDTEAEKHQIDFKAKVEVYNINGVRVGYGIFSTMQFPTGLYIIRQGNVVQKTIIKSY